MFSLSEPCKVFSAVCSCAVAPEELNPVLKSECWSRAKLGTFLIPCYLRTHPSRPWWGSILGSSYCEDTLLAMERLPGLIHIAREWNCVSFPTCQQPYQHVLEYISAHTFYIYMCVCVFYIAQHFFFINKTATFWGVYMVNLFHYFPSDAAFDLFRIICCAESTVFPRTALMNGGHWHEATNCKKAICTTAGIKVCHSSAFGSTNYAKCCHLISLYQGEVKQWKWMDNTVSLLEFKGHHGIVEIVSQPLVKHKAKKQKQNINIWHVWHIQHVPYRKQQYKSCPW